MDVEEKTVGIVGLLDVEALDGTVEDMEELSDFDYRRAPHFS